jgi:dihydrofolate reductase/uncharacterized protein YciI
MTRPRCAAFLAMSMDGFIARPDGRVDWLDGFEAPPEEYTSFFASVDTVLIGRATYDFVTSYEDAHGAWPYGAKPVAVLTHRPPSPRHGEVFLAGEPAEVLARLAASGSKSVYVDGGAVVSQFLAAGLIDELTVTSVPVVLGAGRRLFQGSLPERRFSLVESRAHPSGLVRSVYRPIPADAAEGSAATVTALAPKHFVLRLIPPRPTFPRDMTAEEGAAMQRHVAYWTGHLGRGSVLLFGPVLDPKGTWGVAVVAAQSEAEVEALERADPVILAGLGFRYERLPMATVVTAA